MREQHPYKMTPDQGWSQMSFILNKAMPVERRSRRFIVFWWTAAAGITAALISVFALMNKPASVTPSIATQQNNQLNTTGIEEAQIQKPDFNHNPTPQPSTITSSGNSKDEVKIVKQNSTIAQKTSEQKEITNNSTVAANTTQQKGITGNSTLLTSGQPEITAEITNNQENISHATASVNQTETQTNIPLADRNNPSVDFLPSVWASDLEFPSIQINATDNILVFNTQKKKLITPHLAVSGMQGFTNGIGAHGGAGVDVNLTQRLSVSTDLGYNVYNPDATIFGTAAETDFAGSEAILRDDLGYQGIGTYLPAEEVSNASAGVVSHFVRTVRQWQFSAGLKYDLNRKFFAEGGIAIGFGTTTRSTYPVVTNGFADPLTNTLKVSNSLDDYDVVRSNTTSLYGSIGYRPCAKTEIFAQWTHGLDPYLLNDPTPLSADAKRADYIRGINLGLRYTL